jgi:hypothetical protein
VIAVEEAQLVAAALLDKDREDGLDQGAQHGIEHGLNWMQMAAETALLNCGSSEAHGELEDRSRDGSRRWLPG